MKLKFNTNDKIVEILASGEVQLSSLYNSIREWEASEIGITFDVVIEVLEMLNFLMVQKLLEQRFL